MCVCSVCACAPVCTAQRPTPPAAVLQCSPPFCFLFLRQCFPLNRILLFVLVWLAGAASRSAFPCPPLKVGAAGMCCPAWFLGSELSFLCLLSKCLSTELSIGLQTLNVLTPRIHWFLSKGPFGSCHASIGLLMLRTGRHPWLHSSIPFWVYKKKATLGFCACLYSLENWIPNVNPLLNYFPQASMWMLLLFGFSVVI